MENLEAMAKMIRTALDEILKPEYVWNIFYNRNKVQVFVRGDWLVKQDFVRGKRFYYTAADALYHHIAVDVWGVTFTACLNTNQLCQLWAKTREEAEPENIVKLEKVA